MKRTVSITLVHIISNKEYDEIVLPWLPESYEIEAPQNNVSLNIETVGDMTLFGNPGLKTLELTSYFPENDYGFQDTKITMKPMEYINKLKEWKEDKHPTLVLISNIVGEDDDKTTSDEKFYATIESLKYGQDDATGDIKYTISLKEYRYTSRIVKKLTPTKHVVVKGDTLKKLAKKYFGKTSKKYTDTIYKKNKAIIEKAAKGCWLYKNKYGFTVTFYKPTGRELVWIAKNKYKRIKHPYKSSKNGKILIPGITLIIKEEWITKEYSTEGE